MNIKLIKLFVLSPFIAFSCNSHALSICNDLYISNGAENEKMNINVGHISIESDSDVGSVLYSKDFLYESLIQSQVISCKTSSEQFLLKWQTFMIGSMDSIDNVYNTNIPGIGIKISMYQENSNANFPSSPTPTPFKVNLRSSKSSVAPDNGGVFDTNNLHLKVEIFKTGPVSKGGRLFYSVPRFSVVSGGNALNVASLNIVGLLTDTACTVDDSTPRTVDMGIISTGDLSTIGSIANKRDFSLIFNCNANTPVSLTMSGVEDSKMPGVGVLAVSSDGSSDTVASGVGIQLLYNNQILPLNHLMKVGTTTSSRFEVPLSARYYRTGKKITPGKINSVVSYTLTYN